MKTLTKSLLAVVAVVFFMTSCAGDPTASNPDIAKLSDASKKSLEEASKAGCKCLKEHGKDLQDLMKELKPLLADAEKAENPMEIMGKMMGSMGKMKNFGECFEGAVEKKSEEEEKAMEEDMKKILGENPDRKAGQKKMMEIMSAYFGKNCPNEQKIFQEFMEFGEQMQAIGKKRKSNEEH